MTEGVINLLFLITTELIKKTPLVRQLTDTPLKGRGSPSCEEQQSCDAAISLLSIATNMRLAYACLRLPRPGKSGLAMTA